MIYEKKPHLRQQVEGISFSHLTPDCYKQVSGTKKLFFFVHSDGDFIINIKQ